MTEGKRVKVTNPCNPEFGRTGEVKVWCTTFVTVLLDGNPPDWVSHFRREDLILTDTTITA